MKPSRTEHLIFAALALAASFFIVRLVAAPNITDAFYHFNAANELVQGRGLTDHYLWVYIGAPDRLPAPSHLYWMPLTSLSAALGMALLNAPGSYAAAQFPLALMLAGTIYNGFWLGARLGETRRHTWMAGLLTLCGGYFIRFWGATDTFAPYAFIGSTCLVLMGLAAEQEPASRRYYAIWMLVGALAALGHLTRADGLLLLIVAWEVALRSDEAHRLRPRLLAFVVATLAYLLLMAPWFARNLALIASPLPLGGTQGIWFTEYNDLFRYPAALDAQRFFANGPSLFFSSRWEALTNNLGTLIAVEGMIVLAPLMLIALWRRRQAPFLRGFAIYAIALHLAMTFIFPFPGYRGGLFHSAAALFPWWMALGVLGLDDSVAWIARRRRHWKPASALRVFSLAILAFAVFLSLSIAGAQSRSQAVPPLYQALAESLPADARVMINDPAQLYYYTGLGGVVLPHEKPAVIPQIAQHYEVDYLVIESDTVDGRQVWAISARLEPIVSGDLPDFLREIEFDVTGVKLYAINP